MFKPENIIYTYSRKKAIEDGLQVCVSEQFKSDTRMYKFPVYFTQEVWKLCQGKGVIVWDICYMSALAAKAQKTDGSLVKFSVIVQEAERQPDFLKDSSPCYRLWAEIGAQDMDDPAPAVTIMFPNER